MTRITIESRGSFRKTENFLKVMDRKDIYSSLARYGQEGANALAAATPVDDGETSRAWTYTVTRTGKFYAITWYNHNVVSGVPVVILLQYGHATKNGGFVQGRDFINPVIKPLFDRIAYEVWKEVKRA